MLALRSMFVALSGGLTLLTINCSGSAPPLFQSTTSAANPETGGNGSASSGIGGKASGTGGRDSIGVTGGAEGPGGGSGGMKSSGGTKGSGGTSAGGRANIPASGGTSNTGGTADNLGGSGGASENAMTFFVTGDTAATGNLGGLRGADERCQTLAAAVGRGGVTWHAYLSTENPTVNAIDRIFDGPYYNAKGVIVATDKQALHARAGDSALFVDEKGMRINGQQHDIMTGSNADGRVKTGATCGDWASAEGGVSVGHSDGLGPEMDPTPPYNSWNAAHDGDCAEPPLTGGAGRIYCFVAP